MIYVRTIQERVISVWIIRLCLRTCSFRSSSSIELDLCPSSPIITQPLRVRQARRGGVGGNRRLFNSHFILLLMYKYISYASSCSLGLFIFTFLPSES